MPFTRDNRSNTLNGILFVALFALAAKYIASFPVIRHLHISPLIVGIVLGVFYANSLRSHLPEAWAPGILFSSKTLLRAAIIFYGFRITFQNIADVGAEGIIVSISMVTLTFILGYFVGTKLLKLDLETTLLTSAGSSICGAAAVLATEPVVNAKPYKSAIAVSTVVIFGTISMFLYPFLYRAGVIPIDAKTMGVFIGGTVHEVAHVVAAGNAIGELTAEIAVIVKMIRVMMIAPFLLVLGYWLKIKLSRSKNTQAKKVTIPWFAVFFILVAGFNSFNFLPAHVVSVINDFDTFALTMAMTALGMETNVKNFKGVGFKPIYLAGIIYVWLLFGGFFLTKFVTASI